jgi:hypothetical protein
MCGSPMKSHTWGDGHAPVSQLDYHIGCVQEENTALRKRVKRTEAIATEAIEYLRGASHISTAAKLEAALKEGE